MTAGVVSINTPRWATPLLDPCLTYLLMHGGRGGGKSHFVAEYIVEACMLNKTSVLCLREVLKSLAQSSKRLIENKISELKVDDYFIIQHDKILHKTNGSIIEFAGLHGQTATSIKSYEGVNIAWVEEAQTISQMSLDLLIPTIRTPGAKLIFTWNPNKENDPIEVLRKDPRPGTCVVQVNYMDNPWFPEILRIAMEYDKSRDIDKYNHVWMGGYDTKSEARIFKNWKVDEFTLPPSTIFRFGCDWGFSDPTVLVRTHVDGKRLYIDYEAYEHNCEIVDLPDLFATIPDSHLYPIVADNARPETISYMKSHGYPRIFPCQKPNIEESIEFLKSYDILIHARCTHTIDEFTNYAFKICPHTGDITNKIPDKKNHVIDATRYAAEAARRIQDRKTSYQTPQPARNYW